MIPSAPSSLVAAVDAALPDLRDRPWHALTGGRTNRLWRVGATVVKSYDCAAASPLFPNDPAAEARALRLLAPYRLAPTLRTAGTGWIAYAHVEGDVWQGDPAPVARTLYRVHHLAPNGFRKLPSGSAALLNQARAIAAECRGTLPQPPADPGIPSIPKPSLIHGDAVPGNLIVGPAGVTLIDWQCPAAGDPAEDLATFLSPAMHWLYCGTELTSDTINRTLAAYPDQTISARYTALEPLFRWRMAAHCLWKSERGAKDYTAALQLELQ